MGLTAAQGRFLLEESLLLEANGNGAGPWVRLHAVHPCTVTVEGAFHGRVLIEVSNAPGFPEDRRCPAIGMLSTVGTVSTSGPFRWMRAVVTDYDDGAISVFVMGVQT